MTNIIYSFVFWAGVGVGFFLAALIIGISAAVMTFYGPESRRRATQWVMVALLFWGVGASVILVDFIVLMPDTVG
jgi:hypothetical protein